MPTAESRVYDMIFTPFGGDYSSYGQTGGEHSFFDGGVLPSFTPNAPVTAPDAGALAPMAGMAAPADRPALQEFDGDFSAPDISTGTPSPDFAHGYDFDISSDSGLGVSKGTLASGLAALAGRIGNVTGLGVAGQGVGAAIDASNANAALEAVGLPGDVSGWGDFMSRGLTGMFGLGKSAQDQANEISGSAYGFVDPGAQATGLGALGALGAIGPGGLSSAQAAALGIGQAAVGAGGGGDVDGGVGGGGGGPGMDPGSGMM